MDLDSAVAAAVFPPPRRVAVIGISDKPDRASHGVAKTLQHGGFKIYPVRPGEGEILGEKTYPSLADIPDDVDIVDVFRQSDKVPDHLNDILAKKPKVLWMQDGVINDEVAQKARAAGILVVMDDCMARRFYEWSASQP